LGNPGTLYRDLIRSHFLFKRRKKMLELSPMVFIELINASIEKFGRHLSILMAGIHGSLME